MKNSNCRFCFLVVSISVLFLNFFLSVFSCFIGGNNFSVFLHGFIQLLDSYFFTAKKFQFLNGFYDQNSFYMDDEETNNLNIVADIMTFANTFADIEPANNFQEN